MPDARRTDALELYSIASVMATTPDGEERAFQPFFGLRHDADEKVRYWQASRRPGVGARDKGTEIFLSILDREASAGAPANTTLSIDTLCFNRDLLARLAAVGGQLVLDLVSPTPAIGRVGMVTSFTPTRRPQLGGGRLWRLLSHLQLNHLSLSGGEAGAEALREVLRLYDWSQGLETRRLIDGVQSIESRRGLARVPAGASTVITHGLDVDLVLDPGCYPAGGAYLLAAVLESFLGLYAAINTFTRLKVRLSGRSGVLASWPPRTGEKTLL